MRHHAGLNFANFSGMTTRSPASLFRNSQVSRIYEANVVPVFPKPARIGALRIGGRARRLRFPRLRMGLTLGLNISSRIRRSTRSNPRVTIPAVTVRTTQTNRARGMHGGTVCRRVASQTAGRSAISISLRLQKQNCIAALRGSGDSCADRERQTERSRCDQHSEEIVTRNSHVPPNTLRTEILLLRTPRKEPCRYRYLLGSVPAPAPKPRRE